MKVWLGAAAAVSGMGTLVYLMTRSGRRRDTGQDGTTSATHQHKHNTDDGSVTEETHNAHKDKDGTCEQNGRLPRENINKSTVHDDNPVHPSKPTHHNEQEYGSPNNSSVEELSSCIKSTNHHSQHTQNKEGETVSTSNSNVGEFSTVAEDVKSNTAMINKDEYSNSTNTTYNETDNRPNVDTEKTVQKIKMVEEKKTSDSVNLQDKTLPTSLKLSDTKAAEDTHPTTHDKPETSPSNLKPVVEELSQCLIRKPQCDPTCFENETDPYQNPHASPPHSTTEVQLSETKFYPSLYSSPQTSSHPGPNAKTSLNESKTTPETLVGEESPCTSTQPHASTKTSLNEDKNTLNSESATHTSKEAKLDPRTTVNKAEIALKTAQSGDGPTSEFTKDPNSEHHYTLVLKCGDEDFSISGKHIHDPSPTAETTETPEITTKTTEMPGETTEISTETAEKTETTAEITEPAEKLAMTTEMLNETAKVTTEGVGGSTGLRMKVEAVCESENLTTEQEKECEEGEEKEQELEKEKKADENKSRQSKQEEAEKEEVDKQEDTDKQLEEREKEDSDIIQEKGTSEQDNAKEDENSKLEASESNRGEGLDERIGSALDGDSSNKKGSVRSRDDSASADLDCDVGSEHDNINCDSSSLKSMDSGQGSSEIEPETLFIPSTFPVSNQEQYIFYDFEMPQMLVGRLIGRKGAFINKIKASTDATVIVHPHRNRKLKLCSVEGTKQQVTAALEMIRKHFPESQYPDITLRQLSTQQPAQPQVQPTLNAQTMQIELTAGVVVEVRVSAVVSGGELWIQQPLHPSYSALHRLQTCMNLNYGDGSNTPPLPSPISDGTVCVAHINDHWMRCQVLSSSNTMTAVLLLDVGGSVTVPSSSLRQIRYDYMTLPFQASQCFLHGVQPLKDDAWSESAASVMEELVNGVILFAVVVSYTEDYVPLVNLYRRDQDHFVLLNEKLVELGHAQWISTQPIS